MGKTLPEQGLFIETHGQNDQENQFSTIQMSAAWFINKLFKQAPNMEFLNMAYNS